LILLSETFASEGFLSDGVLIVPGSSLAYIKGKDISTIGTGFDLTLGYFFRDAFMGLWFSAGNIYCSYASGNKNAFYCETGFWFFANVGIGYTFTGPRELKTSHLFLGLPIPINNLFSMNIPLLIEPYIRRHFNEYHTSEKGVLLKIMFKFD
jgi:hypothetical protein